MIVAILDNQQLHDFCQLAHELEMAVLVESHTLDELERALVLPIPHMGIPQSTESGINNHQDILFMVILKDNSSAVPGWLEPAIRGLITNYLANRTRAPKS